VLALALVNEHQFGCNMVAAGYHAVVARPCTKLVGELDRSGSSPKAV
jgi:hypothetical protein